MRKEMRRALLVLVGLLIFAGTARAQDTPRAEFSVDYSYFRAGFHGGANLRGGRVSGAVNVGYNLESDVSTRLLQEPTGPWSCFRAQSEMAQRPLTANLCKKEEQCNLA